MGTPAMPQGRDQAGEAQVGVVGGQVAGQHHDDGQLGRFRRLQLERTEREPGLGALHVLAHDQHRSEQTEGAPT